MLSLKFYALSLAVLATATPFVRASADVSPKSSPAATTLSATSTFAGHWLGSWKSDAPEIATPKSDAKADAKTDATKPKTPPEHGTLDMTIARDGNVTGVAWNATANLYTPWIGTINDSGAMQIEYSFLGNTFAAQGNLVCDSAKHLTGKLSFLSNGKVFSSADFDLSPSPTQTPTVQTSKFDSWQMAFDEQETARLATGEATQERVQAANQSQSLATAIAWRDFDTDNFDDAATWFARIADLKKDALRNRVLWTENIWQNTQTMVEKAIAQRRAQLASVKTEHEKSMVQSSLDSMLSIQYSTQHTSLSTLQTLAHEDNDFPSAQKYDQQLLALEIARLNDITKVGTPVQNIWIQKLNVARALEEMAWTQAESTQFADADKNYHQALAIRRALPPEFTDRAPYETLSDLGLMYYYNVGDLKQARDYYEQAVTQLEADEPNFLKSLDDVTPPPLPDLSPENQAYYQKTWAQTQRELKPSRLTTHLLDEGTMLNNLGDVAMSQGNLTSASSYYNRALNLESRFPMGNDPYGIIDEDSRRIIHIRTMGSLAFLHSASGEVDRALSELDEVVLLSRQSGNDETVANTLAQVAGLWYEKGDLNKARRYTEQARTFFASAQKINGVAMATGSLSFLAREAKQPDEAAKYALQQLPLARQSGNFNGISGAAINLAAARLDQKRLDEVEPLIQEAETANAHTGSVENQISTLSLRGQLLEAQGKNDAALEKYKAAIDALEKVRATSASEETFGKSRSNTRIYERIVKLLIKMNRPQDAFEYLNRAKSKQLQDALSLSNVQSRDPQLQALLDRAKGLQERGRVLDAQIQNAPDATQVQKLKLIAAANQQEFYDVAADIEEKYPTYASLFTVDPTPLGAAQSSIPDDTILVEYAPVGDQLYIFLVTRDSLKIYTPDVHPEEIWNRIRSVRKQIDTRSPMETTIAVSSTGNDEKALGKARGMKLQLTDASQNPYDKVSLDDNLSSLYDQLIAPIAPEIGSKKVLAFIPTQLLYYLPMQALLHRDKAAGTSRYLIEEKQIAYLSAADVMNLVKPRDNTQMGKGLMALGDPTGADLPHALEEVQAISTIFPASQVLTGNDATKNIIEAPDAGNFRILHFATHGILNPNAPRRSYILLAADKNATAGSEQLQMSEVWGLKLNKVDLVTISACETALGTDHPGTEIMSLATAFSKAQAHSVVASLWSVSDDSTKDLMVEFYTGLAKGDSKALALQKAQIRVLKDPQFAHPYYWAPFVLMGDWR